MLEATATNEEYLPDDEKQFADYIDLIKRRRKSVTISLIGAAAITVLLALFWPETYRSSATILIEEQDIPGDMVRSTVTSFAAQRIQVISARVMTRPNLLKLIKQFDLYQDERAYETTEEIVERMRENTKLETISADVVDPSSGRPVTATIAFTLSYDNEHPNSALKVANELTTLFLNENLKNRQEKAAEASRFITEEAKRIGLEIGVLEGKLAEFKRQHGRTLPEYRGYNLQQVQRLERDITDTETALRSLKDRKFYLQGQLAQINPSTPIFSSSGERIYSPTDRLTALETEYLQLSNTYKQNHPDLLKMHKEIETLKKEIEAPHRRTELQKQLMRLKSDLEKFRKKYRSNHPDIIAQQKKINALESVMQGSSDSDDGRDILSRDPDNPAYITLQAQLNVVNNEFTSNTLKLYELKTQLDAAEKRLYQSAGVEKEYLLLTRDHENALQKFREVKAKEMEATISQELERENKGERFSLIEAPAYPEEPIRPNRPAIIIVGFIIALALGISQAFVREAIAGTVHVSRDLVILLGTTPLTAIPYFENEIDVAIRKKRTKYFWVISLGCIFVTLVLIHVFFSPLDVLWFRIIRKLGALFS